MKKVMIFVLLVLCSAQFVQAGFSSNSPFVVEPGETKSVNYGVLNSMSFDVYNVSFVNDTGIAKLSKRHFNVSKGENVVVSGRISIPKDAEPGRVYSFNLKIQNKLINNKNMTINFDKVLIVPLEVKVSSEYYESADLPKETNVTLSWIIFAIGLIFFIILIIIFYFKIKKDISTETPETTLPVTKPFKRSEFEKVQGSNF